MLHGRKRLMVGVAGIAAAVGISLAPTTPSTADPDVDDVQSKVDRLYHQAEVASERYNDAKLKASSLRKDLAELKRDEKSQRAKVAKLERTVGQALAAQYEGQTMSATGELVVSEDPEAFLAELTRLSAYNANQKQHVDSYQKEIKALTLREEATEQRSEELEATKKELGEAKDEVDEKLADAKELLADLKAEERAEIRESASRGTVTRTPSSVPASGRAQAAVNYALAQVGDSYVYGAAGPSAFDCSGLTMMAWAQAGVGLPHSSSAQMGSGTPVSSSALQPGDLVFYYSPVSHVGIYIGNGQIVHAANPGTGVTVSGVHTMPFAGAVRPG